jgi:hypothetical protein
MFNNKEILREYKTLLTIRKPRSHTAVPSYREERGYRVLKDPFILPNQFLYLRLKHYGER